MLIILVQALFDWRKFTMENSPACKFKDSLVQIYTRTPVNGRCKTRLAKDTGNLFAAQLQAMMLDVLIKRITLHNLCAVQLWFHGDEEYFTRYSQFACYRQTGSSLGERMNAGLNFGLGEYKNVILIGSDCITHTADLIETALYNLHKTDVVIAPAQDGGYTLIGSRIANLPVFTDIPWGEENVYEMTIQRLISKQISYFELPVQNDVDHYTDLAHVCIT